MRKTIKLLCFIVAMLMTMMNIIPIFATEKTKADYSITPDYSARYPHGVIELYESELQVEEGKAVELRLIRMGGTEGRVSVEVKAIDISAKFGVDYRIRIGLRQFSQDKEYSGTLIENYLEEMGDDYITSDEMLTDEIYKKIIGYDPDKQLSDEEASELVGASVDMIADLLGITTEEAMEIVRLNEQDTDESEDDEEGYKSSIHELKDAILGKKTASNGMSRSDMFNMDSLLGNNDENLAASAINDAAVGASLIVTFADGENEKIIRIRALDDHDYEPQEVFAVGLCNPTGGAELGEIINTAIVIDDNEEQEKSTIGFDSTLVTVGSDEMAASIDILRSGCLNDYTEVSVRTVSVNSKEGEDYLPVDTTAVFLPGEERKTVIVPLKTSIKDQTDLKSLDVNLSCETDNADLTNTVSTIHIEPRKASNYFDSKLTGKIPGVDYSKWGEPIVIDVEKVASLDQYGINTAELFKYNFFNNNKEDSLIGIGRIEIDLYKGYSDIIKRYVFAEATDGKKTINYFLGEYNHFSYSDEVDLYYNKNGTVALTIDGNNFQERKELSIKLRYTQDANLVKSNSKKTQFLLSRISTDSKRLCWREITVEEIRIYPVKIQTFPKEVSVQGEYRIFDGTGKDKIVSTQKYDAGLYKLPEYTYRGWVISEGEGNWTNEAAKRNLQLWGYTIKSETYSRTITKKKGSVFTADDFNALLDYNYTSYGKRPYLSLTPILQSNELDYITVEEYNSGYGALKIGNKTYNNEIVKSSDWREGDELYIYVEALFGYKCDKIQITRSDGSVEYIKPGEKTMLTKGMKVKPLLMEEDIVVTLKWRYDAFGEFEGKDKFMSEYIMTSDHKFTDNGDGSYTFSNMTPGDTVTLIMMPKNQNDTGVTVSREYLETLSTGSHKFTMVTDKGESSMTLTVLAADYEGEYDYAKYKVSSGAAAVWKKGETHDLVIVASSNEETVTGISIDDKSVPASSYTAEKGYVRDSAGWWLRTTSDEEKRMSNDMRYMACVGDAYAFEVDDCDMTIQYGLIRKEGNTSGALVRGRVVTNGGTIKRPSNVTITAKNVDLVGVPVAGAIVSVLSNDPTEQMVKDGVYYYTTATTDKHGNFTVYLPGYAVGGLGYCISIMVDNKVYQEISSYQFSGTTVFQIPYQNSNFQIDKMTLGSDLDTTAIGLLDTNVKLGVHLVVASGYRAQRLVFRSYSRDGILVKEWSAEVSTAEGWSYESTFKPSECLREGGRLTVEVYDQYGRGQGEFNTGYIIKAVPKEMAVTLPQFDPKQSVSLPIIGDMTTVFDMGSSKAKPEEADKKSKTDIGSAGAAGDKNYLEITFGASSAIKNAVKAAKKDKGYADMNAQSRALLILSNIRTGKEDQSQIGKIDGKDTPKKPSSSEGGGDNSDTETGNENKKMDNEPKIKSGEGKSSLEFNYVLGVYMSLYSQDGKCYFEDMTLYANLSVSASATRQFFIYGVPVYLKLGGSLTGEFLVHVDPIDGKPVETGSSYYNDSFAEKMQSAGVFHFNIKYSIGAGLGNPKTISIGVSGLISMDIDYQPWKDGAGIVSFSFDAEGGLFGIKVKYNIYKTSYGMFKTKGYTGPMDFSKVANADKFVEKKNQMPLLSYRDANSQTDIYGSIESRGRGSSLNEDDSSMLPNEENAEYSEILGSLYRKGVTDTVTPILLPIQDGDAVLYLRLDDDSNREDNDFSSVAYSIIYWNGYETPPQYLDNDGTFDSNLTAAAVGDGKILVVWSDLDRSLGDNNELTIGESLNHTNLSYCIFDSEGNPGEVRKLTDGYGCDGLPSIAYDKSTGKTVVVYTVTDYETEGVTFGEDNLDEFGNFIYNSYSTVCFKVLDENGDIVTEYNNSSENNYSDYEEAHGLGILDGIRYLNTQVNQTATQATIDELSAAAREGIVYFAYSLDMDKSTITDEDREIYVVSCDLTNMVQSDPVRITSDGDVDANPQVVTYRDEVLMFWNNNGVLTKINVEELIKAPSEESQRIEEVVSGVYSNSATSYKVIIQPDGNLFILWTDWIETDGKLLPSILFSEYDPDFKTPTGIEEDPFLYGKWGNVQSLDSVDQNQDVSEIAFIDVGDKAMISYKVTNKGEDGELLSYDLYLCAFEAVSSLDLGVIMKDSYPHPGDTIEFEANASNTGSLPSEKVSMIVDLIDSKGNVTNIAYEVIDDCHVETVSVTIKDFVFPENPQDYKIRVTAWEDDLEDSACVEEFDLPYNPDITASDIELAEIGDNRYSVSLDVENDGNKTLEGKVLVGFYKDNGQDEEREFTTAGDVAELVIAPDSEVHEVLFFEVPDERYDEDGVCEVSIVVIDEYGYIYEEQSIFLHKMTSEVVVPESIVTSLENDELTMKEGEKFNIDATIAPHASNGEYSVVYKVEDSSVATIDTFGNVSAIKGGETTITVSVVKNEMALFINSNGESMSGDGKTLTIDNNGDIGILVGGEEQESILTKTISLKVNGTQVDPPETSEPSTPQQTDNSTIVIICVAIGVLLIAGAVVAVILIKKRKN